MSEEILEQIFRVKQGKKEQSYQDKLPDSVEVINFLLKSEKSAQSQNQNCSLANLLGSWDLCLITGTKKSREKAGIILGAGKYIPSLIKIKITYQSDKPSSNLGQVVNSVKIFFLELSLTGPVKFIPQTRILAFDFTYLKLTVWGWNIYQGYWQNGLSREMEFSEKKLKDQAFFKYFLLADNFLAARGKGGGIALWIREKSIKIT